MITRKEEIFVKPFQQRLYLQHKNKLKSAMPRIDMAQPKNWPHILLKEKKYQKEQERCSQILLNNSILFQHLSEIMSAKRIDNIWNYQKPKFFHRVNLYTKCNSKLNAYTEDVQIKSSKIENEVKKIKCFACNPNLLITKPKIPEERIPWDPPKQKLSKKLRSLSIHNDKDSKNVKKQILNKSKPLTVLEKHFKPVDNKLNVNKNLTVETFDLNYIEINEGSLDLIIKFPPRSKVSIFKGNSKQIV